MPARSLANAAQMHPQALYALYNVRGSRYVSHGSQTTILIDYRPLDRLRGSP